MNRDFLLICEDLMQLCARMKALTITIAERQNLTPAQLLALYWIGQNANLLMGEVAMMLNCDASNVTGIVDRLVAHGLVERREGSKDRRRKTPQLTDEGRKKIQLYKQELAAGLGWEQLTPTERETLHTVVTKLCAR